MHLFWYIFMCSLLLASNVQAIESNDEKLDYHSSFNKIVRDLIKNWDSPIVYLKQRGYLSNDFKDTSEMKPTLDALLAHLDDMDQKQLTRFQRTPVSSMYVPQAPLSQMPITNVETPSKQSIDGQNLKQQQKPAAPETEQRLAQSMHETVYPTVDELMAQLQVQQQLQHQAPAAKHVQQRAELQPHTKHFDDTLQRIIQNSNANAQPMPFEKSNSQQQEYMHNKFVNAMAMPAKVVKMPVADQNVNANAKQEPAPDAQYGAAQPVGSVNQISKPNAAPVRMQPANGNIINHLLKLVEKEPLPRLFPQSNVALNDAQQPPNNYNLDQSMSTAKKEYDFEKAAQYFEMKPDDFLERIHKPYHLNWDLKKRRLQSLSPLAQEAYVNNIIKIYANDRRRLETQQKILTQNA